MDITIWGFTFVVLLLGAFITAFAGFGFALVNSALLLFFLEPKTVIVYNLFLGIFVVLPVFWRCRNFARPRQLILLGISSVFGLPLGIYILSQLATPILKLIIAGLVVVFAILLALGYSFRIKRENLGSIIVGFISGTLASSTSLGGPPVILFLVNQGYDKDCFRATITAYLSISSIVALLALVVSGAVTSSMLASSLYFLPALAIGFLLGIKFQPNLNANIFRRITTGIVIIAGVMALFTSLTALL